MTWSDALRPVREAAALSDQPETAVIRVSGEHAWDVLDRQLTCDLYLRDGQARPALLLHEDGRVAADVMVLCADETFWLLVDGADGATVSERLTAAIQSGEDATVRLETAHTVAGLDGPFAWEVLAAHAGRGVIGLPLLSFFTMDDGTLCLRDGRLGEYGYRFVAEQGRWSALDAALCTAADRVSVPLGRIDRAARRTCMLENHVFCADSQGQSDLDAGELQLGWRLSVDKDVPGLAAVRERPTRRRTVTFRAPAGPGVEVETGGQVIGRVLQAEPCSHGPGWIGLAAVPEALAHPGISTFSAGGVSLLTVSPPLVANRSLFINPQHHRWQDQAAITLPADPATSRAPGS